MLAFYGLTVLITQELTGEYIVSIAHSIELSESYSTPSEAIWSSEVVIGQSYQTNLKSTTLENTIEFSSSFNSANKFLNILEPIFMSDLWVEEITELQDDEAATDTLLIDHVLVVGHEANKALTQSVTMLSEFFVFTVTQGEDYGNP